MALPLSPISWVGRGVEGGCREGREGHSLPLPFFGIEMKDLF